MKVSLVAAFLMLIGFLAIAPRPARTESEYTDADRMSVSVSNEDLTLGYEWYDCYQGDEAIPCE